MSGMEAGRMPLHHQPPEEARRGCAAKPERSEGFPQGGSIPPEDGKSSRGPRPAGSAGWGGGTMLAGKRRLRLEDGRSLRLLTAMEVLEARREAETLCQGERERALCSNACLLARALERRGRPVFPDGRAVLKGLRVEQIRALSARWGAFNRAENPSATDGEEVVSALKKAWSTRRMSG